VRSLKEIKGQDRWTSKNQQTAACAGVVGNLSHLENSSHLHN